MALKFDGKYLKDGGRTLCNVSGDKIREGSGIKTLCNIKGGTIREGSGIKTLCNVSGGYIREGSGIKKLIKTSDAARKIGATFQSPLVAAIWYLFCR